MQENCMKCKEIVEDTDLEEIAHKDGSHYNWCNDCIKKYKKEVIK